MATQKGAHRQSTSAAFRRKLTRKAETVDAPVASDFQFFLGLLDSRFSPPDYRLIRAACSSLLNLSLMWTGVTEGAFGMHSAPGPLFGIPWGVLIGGLVVIMAAYSLVLDFDMIQQGVRNGAPRQYGWLGAFGMMVTIVWLYIEILRIIAIARGDG